MLLAGSSGPAMRRAEATVEASGLRIGARLPIDEALDRLKVQASAKAVWLELDRDCGEQMDEIIRRVNYDVSRGFYAAVVSVTAALVDPVTAQIDDDAIDVLIDANEAERTAALALAVSRHSKGAVADVGRDRSAERLRQLSEEVSRIASSRARLSTGPTLPPLPPADQRSTAALFAFVGRDGAERHSGAPPSRPLFFRKSSSRTPPGTCSWIYCRQRSRSCGFRSRACASRPRSRRLRRYGG